MWFIYWFSYILNAFQSFLFDSFFPCFTFVHSSFSTAFIIKTYTRTHHNYLKYGHSKRHPRDPIVDNEICTGFLCDQNKCLPKALVCDGVIDCPLDETDEKDCDNIHEGLCDSRIVLRSHTLHPLTYLRKQYLNL